MVRPSTHVVSSVVRRVARSSRIDAIIMAYASPLWYDAAAKDSVVWLLLVGHKDWTLANKHRKPPNTDRAIAYALSKILRPRQGCPDGHVALRRYRAHMFVENARANRSPPSCEITHSAAWRRQALLCVWNTTQGVWPDRAVPAGGWAHVGDERESSVLTSWRTSLSARVQSMALCANAADANGRFAEADEIRTRALMLVCDRRGAVIAPVHSVACSAALLGGAGAALRTAMSYGDVYGRGPLGDAACRASLAVIAWERATVKTRVNNLPRRGQCWAPRTRCRAQRLSREATTHNILACGDCCDYGPKTSRTRLVAPPTGVSSRSSHDMHRRASCTA